MCLKWIFLFLITFPAWAYRLTSDFTNGFYWSELPINITVVENNPQLKQKLESISQTAIQEWEAETGLSLWDFSKSEASAASTNIIRWSNNFAAETNMDPKSVLAVAIRYTNGPYFAKTEIIINGDHELNKNDSHLRTTITHELGHTMGLDHSNENMAVMAPSLQTYYWGLHDDDIQGMNEVHGQTHHRQVSGYVSPLSYEETSKAVKGPLSCGTVAPVSVSGPSSFQGPLSIAGGILISFIRKLLQWFKSRF